MSLLAAFGALSNKEALSQLKNFHEKLVKWRDFYERHRHDDNPEPFENIIKTDQELLEAVIPYLDFLQELGVLDAL